MKGRLTQVEKYSIQGMLHASISIEDIATNLSRTISCIQKYVDNELTPIQNTIAKVQVDKIVTKETVKTTVPKGQAKRTMILKTDGNKSGVAIMTHTASEVGDEFLKNMPKQLSRTARNSLYKADTGEKI